MVSLLGAGTAFAEQDAPYIDIRKVAAVTEGHDGYSELYGAYAITTAQINSRHYALVAALADHGVQIIDITDPSSPSAVTAINDGIDGYSMLYGASSVTTTQIGSRHYALVAAFGDDGVQMIDITDPSSPSAVSAVEDGAAYPTLGGAQSITTTQINSRHYALVAASTENGIQIINITDPSSPSPVASVTDGAAYPTLGGAHSITTTQINSRHYALVAALFDSGVQIIDITDPSSPSPVASVTDGATYPTLGGAYSITTTQINSRHYALVAAYDENGVQIIDITDPSSPSPVASVTDGAAYTELNGASSITTAQINSRHYALVSAWGDDGVQMIDITDPSSPSPVASATDSTTYTEYSAIWQCEHGARCDSASNSTTYTELHGASSITTTQINSRHYALVSAFEDSGVQIIGIAQSTQQPQPPTLETEAEVLAPDAEAVWSAVLSPYGTQDSSRGCWGAGDITGCHVHLRPHTFAYGGETYEAYLVALTTKGFLTVRFNNTIPGAQDATLVINGTSFDFDASTNKFPKWHYRLDWSGANNVTISLRINEDQETLEPVTTITSAIPVIILTGSPQMTIPVNTVYTEPGYTATDQEDGDLTGNVVVTGSVNATKVGTYHLYYDVTDSSGNAATRQVRTVSVADQTAPVITLTGSPQMTITVGSAYAEPGYAATDNYDGDLTGSVVITGSVNATGIGTYHLYYDVSDSSGNAATRQVRTVSVADQTAPVITLTGSPQMTITVGSAYAEPGYAATDNYDGDLTGSVVITGTVDAAREGTYHLYYDVSDGSGNAATRQVRTVSVTPETAPVITLVGAAQIVLPLGATYAEPGYTATDRDDGDLTGNVTVTKTVSYCLPLPLPAGCNDPTGGVPVTGDVYTGRVGTYTFYYDVTDSSGNAAIQQVRKVSVNDETAPVIILEGASQMTITVGSTYVEPGYTAPDNYEGDVTGRVIITGTVDTSQVGTYHLYYDVTDPAGNAAIQQVRTVIVAAETDTTPDPQAGLSDVVKRYDADGNGVIDQQEWAKAIEDYTNDILTNEDIYAISAARS